ncbi:MAG TPA: CAP domain-containing protein [Noviherbaspirillum sp.]
MLNRINQARAVSRSCGGTFYPAVAAMTWNSKLFDASAAHALDMASNNYFSHNSLDGRTFSQRITAAGYAWASVGENIAAGYPSIEQVMNGWLQSPGHCANIMNGTYTEVGVACGKNDASTYKTYWVMDLGRPQS